MAEPLLEARGIVKSFGRVRALRGADFTVYPGEVVALIGDNGAGKSTLVKTLSGVIHPDEGEIRFEGRPVAIASPTAARELGIETVYQDLALAPDLESSANLFLGREAVRPGLLGKLGFLDKGAMRRRTEEAFRTLGVGVQDATAAVGSWTPTPSCRNASCVRRRIPALSRKPSLPSRPLRRASRPRKRFAADSRSGASARSW